MSLIRNACVAVAGLALTMGGLVGCAHRQDVIPPTARLQMSGNGQKVWTSPSDGMAYIFDKPGDRLIWSGQVRQGQMVGVNPEKNEISLNNSTVSNSVRIGDGRIDVYFEPTTTAVNSDSAMRSQEPSNVRQDRSPQYAPVQNSGNSQNGSSNVSGESFTVQPPPVTITPSVRVEQQQSVPAATVVPSTQPTR